MQVRAIISKKFQGAKDNMAEIFEMIMIVLFGASWPINVVHSYKARTNKGKNLAFLVLIFAGYIFGIISKLVNPLYMAEISSKWYVLFFYILNFLMISADLLLYVRNGKIDKMRLAEEVYEAV